MKLRSEHTTKRCTVRRAAAAALACLLGLAALTGCGQKKLDGSQTALTVNGENVSVGTLSFEAAYESAVFTSYYAGLFGGNGYFDTVADEETGLTYGDQAVDSIVESIRDEVILSQHAADYGVSLTDEEKAEIDTVAQSFMDSNEKAVISKLGVRKEDIVYSMTLDKIRSKMLEPVAADVDTVVSDEEAQETSVTYVTVAAATEDSEENGTAAEQNEAIKAKLNELIEKIAASDNVAEADMDALAKEVDESYSAVAMYFPTNDEEQTSVDAAVAEAVKGLVDGELMEDIIESADGSRYFVVRLDKEFDEERTETHRTSIIADRKQENLTNLIDTWREASEVTINDAVVRLVKITDTAAYTFKAAAEDSEG